MIFHGLISSRTIQTGDGSQNKQRRFYCRVHGWLDLFVFPDAEAKHAKCCDRERDAGAGVEIPKAKAMAQAASPVSILSNIEDFRQHGL